MIIFDESSHGSVDYVDLLLTIKMQKEWQTLKMYQRRSANGQCKTGKFTCSCGWCCQYTHVSCWRGVCSDVGRHPTINNPQPTVYESPPCGTASRVLPHPCCPIGLARREAETTNHSSTSTMVAANNRGTYAHAAAHQPRQQHSRQPTNDKVCVIGTSLTRGLGQRLSSRSISATTYSYPGAQIPLIHNRVPHILPKSNDTTTVLLQCGGNDADSNNPNPVIDQLEGLIRDIRQQRPNFDILFSSIPPRPRNRKALRNINYINDYFRDRGHVMIGLK